MPGFAKIPRTNRAAAHADWQIQIDVMLAGVCFMYTARPGEVLLDRARNVILNISSISGGFRRLAGHSAHNAAKAGVISLTENISCRWARRGVRIGEIAPGVTRYRDFFFFGKYGSMRGCRPGKLQSAYSGGTRSRGSGKRSQKQRFLWSAIGRVYITATTLTVDGSWTAWDNLPHISQRPYRDNKGGQIDCSALTIKRLYGPRRT
jgi:NAD(P)-dependent dehydrogenase (short-subunit alcohol dehydrogenase family)